MSVVSDYSILETNNNGILAGNSDSIRNALYSCFFFVPLFENHLMSSKELLLKELESLGPSEILKIRNYVHQLKSNVKSETVKKPKVDMKAVRKSLSKIKGSLSEFISA